MNITVRDTHGNILLGDSADHALTISSASSAAIVAASMSKQGAFVHVGADAKIGFIVRKGVVERVSMV